MYLPNEFIAKERIEVANKLINSLGLLFTAASQEAKIFCWAKGSFYKYEVLYFPFAVLTETEHIKILIK